MTHDVPHTWLRTLNALGLALSEGGAPYRNRGQITSRARGFAA